jgi:hypothetical protein
MTGYDAWKTHNPADGEPTGAEDPDCTCSRTLRSRRGCPVHGIDPDQAYEERMEG